MGSEFKFGRRGLFAGALAGLGTSVENLHAAQKPGAAPKNIIWMVSDGMSPGVLPLADRLSRIVRGKGLVWHGLLSRPECAHGLMDMASLTSMVTDSSAASSAWGSGTRILNGMVNTLPDGTKLTPLAEIAHAGGKRVGLVTTATVTHATPAGFAAVELRRDDEHKIAEQYVRNADVVLGGGRRFFEAASRPDRTDLIGSYRAQGFAVALNKAELAAAGKAAKLLGLFSRSHVPYTIDHREDAALRESVPTLAEMTSAALASLSAGPRGFLLQVEGARVDHAAHNNDAAAMLWDQIAFDDAIETVLRYAGTRPDTLVVITSDHGNSNPGLNGMGNEYSESDACFERIARVRRSFELLTPTFGSNAEYTMKTPAGGSARPKPAAARVQELAAEYLGFTFNDAEVESIRGSIGGGRNLALNRQLDKPVGIIGQAVGNHIGIGWTGTQHTSDYVLVTALGPGNDRFRGHVVNTGVFTALARFMGSSHRNPTMTPARAREFKQAAFLRRDRPDWA